MFLHYIHTSNGSETAIKGVRITPELRASLAR